MLADALSLEELEEAKRSLAKELYAGKTVSSWSIGDSSAQKFVFPNSNTRSRLALVYEALSIKAPSTYPPSSFQAITRTRVVFSESSSSNCS